jgi:hypothetical protein
MLSTDDLKKLQSIVEKVVDKRAEETELKMGHRFNAVDKRFDTVDKHFEKLEKQMGQDRHDWSIFFNQAGIFFDEMRSQLTKRIKKLEENQGLSGN